MDLVDVAIEEEALLAEARTVLGSLWKLAEEVVESYESLATVLDEGFHAVTPALEGALAAGVLFRAARRSSALELLNLGRRHLSESYLKRRRVLDLLAYSWIAWRDPTAARQWLDANRNWKAYARAYSNRAIAEALSSLGSAIGEWHNKLSQRVHPSRMSLTPALFIDDSEPHRPFRVRLFDTLPYEGTPHGAGWLAEQVLEFVLMHLEVQSAFTVSALDRPSWEPYHDRVATSLRALVGRMDTERASWASTIDAWNEHRLKSRRTILAAQAERQKVPPDSLT